MIGDFFNSEKGLTGEQIIKFIIENELQKKRLFRVNGCGNPLLMTSIEVSETTGNIIVR